jgi:hypothetical protein
MPHHSIKALLLHHASIPLLQNQQAALMPHVQQLSRLYRQILQIVHSQLRLQFAEAEND